jgi:ferredoxin/nitrate reductase gamma subunit
MAMRLDASVLPEMKRYGAFDINACFNCGNCTAVCPLSEGNVAFPRRVIRYAQLGQRDHIAASREVWLCYYCGECSDTCPRQAEPGAFMAAARRYATASFDPLTVARKLYGSATSAFAVLGIVFAALLAIFLSSSAALPAGHADTAKLLKFVPYETIHWTGLGVIVAVVVVIAITLVNMAWMVSRAPLPGAPPVDSKPRRFPLSTALTALWTAIVEIVGQRRYRDCDKEKPAPPEALPVRRWLVHYAIMGGMVGLAVATVYDYFFKTPGSQVALYYPSRLLGTVAGAAFVYGLSVVIIQRLRKPESIKYYAQSLLSDWVLVVLLWAIGATGFILELAEYAAIGRTWVAVIFVVHITFAMELILLTPFTKLGHLIYRPAALWFNEFRRLRAGQ